MERLIYFDPNTPVPGGNFIEYVTKKNILGTRGAYILPRISINSIFVIKSKRKSVFKCRAIRYPSF